MSSATSTDRGVLRAWQFFLLCGVGAATVAVLLARDTGPAGLLLFSAAIVAAALAGLALHRTLVPLASGETGGETEPVGQRTREALEREKMLTLRTIKELEFDRAMGKTSEEDFQELAGRLRARAIGLIQQLEVDRPAYRDLIERELAARLAAAAPAQPAAAPDPDGGFDPAACGDCGAAVEEGARFCSRCGAARAASPERCRACGTINDPDARFCKHCGERRQTAGTERHVG